MMCALLGARDERARSRHRSRHCDAADQHLLRERRRRRTRPASPLASRGAGRQPHLSRDRRAAARARLRSAAGSRRRIAASQARLRLRGDGGLGAHHAGHGDRRTEPPRRLWFTDRAAEPRSHGARAVSPTLRYRIKTVSEMTGIPRNTLIAWERRHGILASGRLANGYRLYSDDDVGFLRRLKAEMASGTAISQALAALKREAPAASPGGAAPVVAAGELSAVCDALFAALMAFDRFAAERVVGSLAHVSYATVMDEVYVPLLRRVGVDWYAGKLIVAQEHFASIFVREQLVAMLLRLGSGAARGLHVACVTFPGDRPDARPASQPDRAARPASPTGKPDRPPSARPEQPSGRPSTARCAPISGNVAPLRGSVDEARGHRQAAESLGGPGAFSRSVRARGRRGLGRSRRDRSGVRRARRDRLQSPRRHVRATRLRARVPDARPTRRGRGPVAGGLRPGLQGDRSVPERVEALHVDLSMHAGGRGSRRCDPVSVHARRFSSDDASTPPMARARATSSTSTTASGACPLRPRGPATARRASVTPSCRSRRDRTPGRCRPRRRPHPGAARAPHRRHPRPARRPGSDRGFRPDLGSGSRSARPRASCRRASPTRLGGYQPAAGAARIAEHGL